MYMWNGTTCACGAVKHVHVKQSCAPEKETFFSEKGKMQHRTIHGIQMRQIRRIITDLLFYSLVIREKENQICLIRFICVL